MTKGQNHCNWHPSQFTPYTTYSTQLMCTRFSLGTLVHYLFVNCSQMYFVTWFWHVYIFNPQFIHMQCIENMWINGNFKSCFGSPCNTNLRASVCWSANARCPMLTQALDHPHNIAACLSVCRTVCWPAPARCWHRLEARADQTQADQTQAGSKVQLSLSSRHSKTINASGVLLALL